MNFDRHFAKLRGFTLRSTLAALMGGAMAASPLSLPGVDIGACVDGPSAAIESSEVVPGGVMVLYHQSVPTETRTITRTSAAFTRSVAEIATSACASLGIPLPSLLEPWSMSASFDECQNDYPEERIRRELDALALYEPLDADSEMPSLKLPEDIDANEGLADTAKPPHATTPNALVGSSVMIMTLAEASEPVVQTKTEPIVSTEDQYIPFSDEISGPESVIAQLIAADWDSTRPVNTAPAVAPESMALTAKVSEATKPTLPATEDYMPYDVASKDLPLWGYSPVLFKPYCIRSRAVFDEIDDANFALNDVVGSGLSAPASAPVSIDDARQHVAEVGVWISGIGSAAVKSTQEMNRQLRVANSTAKEWMTATYAIAKPEIVGEQFVAWNVEQAEWCELVAQWMSRIPASSPINEPLPEPDPVEDGVEFTWSDLQPLIDSAGDLWNTLSDLGGRIASLPQDR